MKNPIYYLVKEKFRLKYNYFFEIKSKQQEWEVKVVTIIFILTCLFMINYFYWNEYKKSTGLMGYLNLSFVVAFAIEFFLFSKLLNSEINIYQKNKYLNSTAINSCIEKNEFNSIKNETNNFNYYNNFKIDNSTTILQNTFEIDNSKTILKNNTDIKILKETIIILENIDKDFYGDNEKNSDFDEENFDCELIKILIKIKEDLKIENKKPFCYLLLCLQKRKYSLKTDVWILSQFKKVFDIKINPQYLSSLKIEIECIINEKNNKTRNQVKYYNLYLDIQGKFSANNI